MSVNTVAAKVTRRMTAETIAVAVTSRKTTCSATCAVALVAAGGICLQIFQNEKYCTVSPNAGERGKRMSEIQRYRGEVSNGDGFSDRTFVEYVRDNSADYVRYADHGTIVLELQKQANQLSIEVAMQKGLVTALSQIKEEMKVTLAELQEQHAREIAEMKGMLSDVLETESESDILLSSYYNSQEPERDSLIIAVNAVLASRREKAGLL